MLIGSTTQEEREWRDKKYKKLSGGIGNWMSNGNNLDNNLGGILCLKKIMIY